MTSEASAVMPVAYTRCAPKSDGNSRSPVSSVHRYAWDFSNPVGERQVACASTVRPSVLSAPASDAVAQSGTLIPTIRGGSARTEGIEIENEALAAQRTVAVKFAEMPMS